MIDASGFALLHLLAVVSGQLFPSFQQTVLLPCLSFYTYSLCVCPAFIDLNAMQQLRDEDGFGAGHLVSTASPKARLPTQN